MGESKNLFEFLMGEENVNQLYSDSISGFGLYNRHLCSSTPKAAVKQNRI